MISKLSKPISKYLPNFTHFNSQGQQRRWHFITLDETRSKSKQTFGTHIAPKLINLRFLYRFEYKPFYKLQIQHTWISSQKRSWYTKKLAAVTAHMLDVIFTVIDILNIDSFISDINQIKKSEKFYTIQYKTSRLIYLNKRALSFSISQNSERFNDCHRDKLFVWMKKDKISFQAFYKAS